MFKFPVVEVFRSIQGEGALTGSPALFVRLAGCNLACPFCDTDFTAKWSLTAEELIKEITPHLPFINMVVFTGGEPLLYADELILLLSSIPTPRFVAIETNGTIEIPAKLEPCISWVTMSPKVSRARCKITTCEEIKILYPYLNGIDARDWIDYPASRSKVLQPIFSDRDYQGNVMRALDEVYRLNELTVASGIYMKKWRLGLQTHKLIHVR